MGGWHNQEAPEVAFGEHSDGSNGGRAIIKGLPIVVVSGILVTVALIFAWQRSYQDTSGSFQAYESPNGRTTRPGLHCGQQNEFVDQQQQWSRHHDCMVPSWHAAGGEAVGSQFCHD